MFHFTNTRYDKPQRKRSTALGVLIIALVVADEHVEIDGLVEGRFVGEAKVVDPFSLSHEFKFVTYPVMELFDLLSTWPLYLHSIQRQFYFVVSVF